MFGYASTTTFTCTLASLAAASSRESSAVSATVGGTAYDDFMAQVTLGCSTATTAADKAIYVWFSGSADGTNYTNPALGSDAAITIGTNHNLRGPFTVSVPAGSTTYNICIPSIAQFFGGVIPKKFNFIFENQTNGALSGTEFTKYLTPVFYTT